MNASLVVIPGCIIQTNGLYTLHVPGQGPGPGLGNNGFLYYTTHYTTSERGNGAIVFYCAHPVPCPCLYPGSVQCV